MAHLYSSDRIFRADETVRFR